MDIWNRLDLLEEYEGVRDAKRARVGKLAFDCGEMRCKGKNKAYCHRGMRLTKTPDGTVPVIYVLKGLTPSICKDCLKEKER